MNSIKEIKNVLDTKELFSIYEKLTGSPVWYISRKSTLHSQSAGFPGFIVYQDNQVHNFYWFGYFEGILNILRKKYKEEHNILLPSKLHRIHLVSKNENSEVSFHKDLDLEDAYSIVGFLTPSWDKNWGGKFYCKEESIDFTPGSFVLIKSNDEHNGLGPNKNIPYWRVVVNYILTN